METKILSEIEKMINDIYSEGKMNLACLLNELEDNSEEAEYKKAIQDIKKRTGIQGTILELFRF